MTWWEEQWRRRRTLNRNETKNDHHPFEIVRYGQMNALMMMMRRKRTMIFDAMSRHHDYGT